MAQCPGLVNATILNTNTTWGQLDHEALQNFSTAAYLRPDVGGALLPWIYTIIVIIIHIPVVIVRVVRWEIVQTWCLVSTLFTIVVYTLAYISTKFAASQILVWTPLLLVIDAGTMLQVFFLAIEANPVRFRGRVFMFDPTRGDNGGPTSLQARFSAWSTSLLARFRAARKKPSKENPAVIPMNGVNHDDHQIINQEHESGDTLGDADAITPNGDNESNTIRKWQDPAMYAAVFSALLFVAVLVLQILGLRAAAAARKTGGNPMVRWCSPSFQSIGIIAAADGDCHTFEIEHSRHKGIGCLQLEGVWQAQWLTGTVVGTSMSLLSEFADLLILTRVNGTTRWREVKMKRPWTTMISGLVVLCITLFFGLQYASMLPPGITENVTMVVDLDGPKGFSGQLTGAGLRGAIIAWSDGLFESFNAVYEGNPPS